MEIRIAGLKEITVWMPPRSGENNGRVLVVGGSWRNHGPPVLAGLAALYSGVDEVTIAVPEDIATPVRCYSPDYDVIKLSDYRLTRGVSRRLLKLVKDADSALIGVGLQRGSVEGAEILAQEMAMRGTRLLLTSEGAELDVLRHLHGKSFVASYSRRSFERVFRLKLSGIPEEDAKIVAEVAEAMGGTILLKGPVDVVSDGSSALMNKTGTSLMTVSGAGAVTEGLAVGFMARGLGPAEAAITATYIAGMAGEKVVDRAGFHAGASEILREIQGVLMRFDSLKVKTKDGL